MELMEIVKMLNEMTRHQIRNSCCDCKECIDELRRACEIYLSNTS